MNIVSFYWIVPPDPANAPAEPDVPEPAKKSALTPMNCTVCNDGNAYAEPNQPDGTYKCLSCRGRE